jgi:hypothetical protein
MSILLAAPIELHRHAAVDSLRALLLLSLAGLLVLALRRRS